MIFDGFGGLTVLSKEKLDLDFINENHAWGGRAPLIL